ncbi:hypothetical protein IFM89_025557 [Coptis chinensis]|uniref:Uncharacterized protein n=1 Tax=Coptis chinensis TaxID=261450 RepID=A0A835HHB1_9MAGN|nr:hypothetical protein IFM89_025557 [Coptis chinensis]
MLVSTTGDHVEVELQGKSEVHRIKGSPSQCSSCDAICAFSKQAYHKSEFESTSRSARKLGGLIILSLIFVVVEIVGGFKANSLAVLTDAAHLLTDVMGFSVSLFAVWASRWQATRRHSFGFLRIEVLGALFSVQLIWVIVGFLVYESIDRILKQNVVVNGKLMFVTAAFGFFINLVMVTWLGHDHSHHHRLHGCDSKEHHHEIEDAEASTYLVHNPVHEHHQCEIGNNQVQNQGILACNENQGVLAWISLHLRKLKETQRDMNLQGAYLHVMGDLIQSVGVMIGGAVIWAKPDWLIVDLLCTLGFSVLVLLTTISLINDIMPILMEGTPDGIDNAKLEASLKCIRGIQAIHDLHIWAISVRKILLSCHVKAEEGANSKEILQKAQVLCEREYGIQHVTIQIDQD